MADFFRYKMVIEYDGAGLYGWQFQDNLPTVQGLLEEATQKLCAAYDPVANRYSASGRTDAGVHALAMTCHVDLPQEYDAFKVMEALNFYLKEEPVSVLDCELVDENFHSRFSSLKRHYLYHIISRRAPLTLMRGLAWQVKETLDVDAMHDAAQILVGTHDFTTFRNVECQSKSPIKTLDYLTVRREAENVYIETGATSFLHNQVRSMVGCLYLVGTGKWSKDRLQKALDSKDRQTLGFNAPPDGLYFLRVDY